ncbi:hypothetical protein C2E23DRAFT_732716 [Lenzites betulinus]|nr:hypothetical protein C2E23DRAFT_732716 [Lenzites betulinus]
MSGTHLVENAQDAGAQSSTHAAEDYAASLRAAALMTLKSKRRKAPVVKVEPAPATRSIAAPPSIELDYGQEDAMGSSSIASSPAVAPAKVAAHLTQEPEPMDIDDSPGREEGEISDSEVSPPPPQMKLEPQSPVLEKRTLTTSPKPSASSTSTAVPPLSLAQPLLPHESFESLVAPALVDENHARPGLAMTQAQYETAKDIVLDLLGWGVPPEYLVGCGLSREIVYYVFIELNLRLPSNLDTTGLPPVSTSQPAVSQASSSTAALRPSLSHPSLPPKPQLSVGTVSDMDDTRSLSATAAPFIPASSEPVPPNMVSSSNTSLHDMEQQRRQELLARKAVLASRKLKQKVAASSISSSRPAEFSSVKDVPMVPTKVVDDFLQSIEPVTTGTASGSVIAAPYTPSSPAPSRSLYDMDMDDVPGLTTGPDLITEYTPLSRPPPARSGSMSTVTTPRSPGVPQSAVPSTSERPFHPPPSRTLSINTTPLSYGGGEDDMDAIPGLFQSQATPDDDDKPPAARRGTKRPVAADFVDMEPGPPKPYTKGPPDYFRANIRRKTTAGFAGLTQRRCVIDVSDSEDDEHDPVRGGDFPMRTDSRASKVVTPQLTAAPTPRGQSPGIPPAPTPSVLQEKEEAIRKMRELIAQREQSRKKKIPVPSRSTPPSSSTTNNGVVAIKQEDDDSAGMHSSDPSRSTSSATPDPTMGGRLYDSQDERSVVDALLTHGMLLSSYDMSCEHLSSQIQARTAWFLCLIQPQEVPRQPQLVLPSLPLPLRALDLTRSR